MPPLAKFRTGHFYEYQTVLVKDSGQDCDSSSDKDLSSDSGSDVQSQKYSFVTSPQDYKICNNVASSNVTPLESQLFIILVWKLVILNMVVEVSNFWIRQRVLKFHLVDRPIILVICIVEKFTCHQVATLQFPTHNQIRIRQPIR